MERLEAAFYAKGQSQFNQAQFTSAGYANGAYDYFSLVAAHEAAHVKTLSDTITQLGGTPVPACNYSFDASGFSTVADYVNTALTLESTGVSAYDGALNAFTSETLMQVAATIATIEARHTSYLSTLTGTSPFPDSLDTAKTPSEIVEAAKSFFVSCPYNLTNAAAAVIIRPTGVATTSTRDAAKPSSQNPAPNTVYTQEQFNNDLVALNYALTSVNSTQWSEQATLFWNRNIRVLVYRNLLTLVICLCVSSSRLTGSSIWKLNFTMLVPLDSHSRISRPPILVKVHRISLNSV